MHPAIPAKPPFLLLPEGRRKPFSNTRIPAGRYLAPLGPPLGGIDTSAPVLSVRNSP